jgi:hypothetical protein
MTIAVSSLSQAVSLGLTHPRRTKLQHGTFLRFGHPRLIFSVRLLATSTKICTIGSSKVSHENLFEAKNSLRNAQSNIIL